MTGMPRPITLPTTRYGMRAMERLPDRRRFRHSISLHNHRLKALLEPAHSFELDAIPFHLHQLDTDAIWIFDPGLAIAIGSFAQLAGDNDATTDEVVDNSLDAVHLQAEVVEPSRLLARPPVTHSVRKDFDKLGVSDTQIDQPNFSILPIQPHDFFESKFAGVEIYRSFEIFCTKRDM